MAVFPEHKVILILTHFGGILILPQISFRVYYRSATVLASNDSCRAEWWATFLIYNSLPFGLNFDQDLGNICPMALELLMIGHLGYSVKCSQRPLDTPILLVCYVQEKAPSCCFFPYLEFHYYNHWSNRIIHLVNCSSCLGIIIFIGSSVTHLVMQDTITCKICRLQVMYLVSLITMY